MKKNALRIALVSCLLLTSLFFGSTAYAQDEELPDPGLTPDSPFYFMDKWGKNIGMFFTFGDEAKARKALQYAEERLSEARTMAARNRVREMERAANDYDGFMAMVRTRMEALEQQGLSDNISETVALATEKHLRVLDRVGDQIPEQARKGLTRAKAASMNGQASALQALAKVKAGRAVDIVSDTIDGRLERARVRATENVTADVEEALNYATTLIEIEEKIVDFAEEKGIDVTAITQRLARATTHRLDVLSDVYERVPENARQGIANAIENSIRKYERAFEKLVEENATGDIPDAATVINRLQEEVRVRLRLGTAAGAGESDNTSVETQVRTENQEQNQGGSPGTGTQPDGAGASANQTENREQNRGRSP